MFAFLFVLIIFASLLKLLFSVSKTAVIILAVAFDYVFIFGISCYLMNGFSNTIATGNAIIFWNIVTGLIAIFIYSLFSFFLASTIPLLAKIVNFIMSFAGIWFVHLLCCIIFVNAQALPLLKNAQANSIANMIIVLVITLPVFYKRLEYFDLLKQNNDENLSES